MEINFVVDNTNNIAGEYKRISMKNIFIPSKDVLQTVVIIHNNWM